ncbi:hypothetical protein [Synechococcus sp. H70.2]
MVAESFQTYLRRRRRLLARRFKHQQGWVVVLALLALYLLSWDVLGKNKLLPLPWLVAIPLLGGGLYSLGAAMIWRLRQRWSTQLLAEMISLPHLALAALIWLGLAIWGEQLSPFLLGQRNQLLAGLVISWLVAQGWSFLRPTSMGEVGQLWADYLQELRASLLQPCYRRLEACRQALQLYQAIWQDLQLEELEAQHLIQLLSESLLPLTLPLKVYAQRVHHCCQQLAALLARMQEQVERLEQVLLEVELVLASRQPFPAQSQPINLWLEEGLPYQELDLQELVCLNQELVGADRSLQGLTQELKGWAEKAIPAALKLGLPG